MLQSTEIPQSKEFLDQLNGCNTRRLDLARASLNRYLIYESFGCLNAVPSLVRREDRSSIHAQIETNLGWNIWPRLPPVVGRRSQAKL